MRKIVILLTLLPLAVSCDNNKTTAEELGSPAPSSMQETFDYVSNGQFKMAGSMSFLNNKLYECGEFRQYGCSTAISGDGTRYQMWNYAESMLDTSLIVWPDDSGYGVASIGTDKETYANTVSFQGFAMYRWAFGENRVVVNDCDTPTRQYVQAGERAETRLALDNGHVYTAGAYVLTRMINGTTLGLIRFSTGADRDTRPFCEMTSIDDAEYDAYELEFTFDGNAPSLQGPWSFE